MISFMLEKYIVFGLGLNKFVLHDKICSCLFEVQSGHDNFQG